MSSGSSPGRSLDASTLADMERRLGHDFSRVRIHPGAHEVTGPLAAAAVTRGQNIYWHPGRFRPDTADGRALLAHELAHTLQTRGADQLAGTVPPTAVSRPGDALERNAEALATGATSRVMAAPAGLALRSSFDSEGADERTRRLTLITSINNALQNLLKLLRERGLIKNIETPHTFQGVKGVTYGQVAEGTADKYFVDFNKRDRRMRRIVRSLIDLATRYRKAPIPAEFKPPRLAGPDSPGDYVSEVIYPRGADTRPGPISSSTHVGTQEGVDLAVAYERYRLEKKQVGDEFDFDELYLNPRIQIVPGVQGARRLGTGTPSGAYMVFPDINNKPLTYWHLTGSSPHPKGSLIVEFLHDDFGYYYENRGQRIDVPNPWRDTP